MSVNATLANPQNQANTVITLTSDAFLQLAKPKTVRISSGSSYIDGQTQTWALPQSGLADCIWFNVSGTIQVAGTVTSGTFQTYPNPAPFSIIRRVRFGSNNSFNLRDMTGWSWYKWIRYRTGVDFLTFGSGTKFSTNSNNLIGLGLSNSIVNGANVVAQTYNVAISLPMPIAYNKGAQQGLIILQVNTLIYNFQIDWGRITGGMGATGGTNDLFTSLVGTSLVYTVSLTSWIGLDWFEPPTRTPSGNPVSYGNLMSAFMSVTDQVYPSVNTGDNVIAPPTQDFYTMVLLEFVNNAAPIAVANLQTIQWQYAGSVYDYLDDYQVKIVRSYYQHNLPTMDGVIDWDLGVRKGVVDMRDIFDSFNDMAVTDLKFHVSIPSSLTLVNPQITGTWEALRLVRQLGV